MKSAKLIFKILKIAVICLSVLYIAFKLYNEKQNGVLFNEFRGFDFNNVFFLLLTLLLVLVNWTLEALKFKTLLIPIQQITIGKSLKAVLAGISVSIFTPKRIGDFGGRVFALEKQNRVNGIFATLLGSYSQLIVTLVIGVSCFPIYWALNSELHSILNNSNLFFLTVLVVILLSLTVYFNIPMVGKFFLRFKFFNKHRQFIYFLQNYSKMQLLKVLAIAFMRYAIFSFQLYILLTVFGVDISYKNAIIGISQIYFYLTLVPTIALGELGVRGSLSVWVFSVFSLAVSGILAASVLLWIFNLAIPAILGAFFLWKFKY